jgi:SAM-dependent methyltransferase
MHVSFLQFLVCPTDKSELTLHDAAMDGNFVRSGRLVSLNGKSYPIREFVPRFVDDDGYAESFSVEWEKHPSILHESASNYSAYRERFTTETKWPSDLRGELLLEAGCGPGAITPFALETGAKVIAFDLSSSVEKACRTIGNNENCLFLQASIFDQPFRPATFDRAFCFGVIQHTPDPAKGMLALSTVLKAGGHLAADSYIVPDPVLGGGHRILRAKYRFRKILSGLPPRALHKIVKAYVAITFPLYKLLRDKPFGIEFMRSLMVDEYRQRMTGMDERFYREFSVLDIFDFLSPKYDIPQSIESFRQIFLEAGLQQIDVHPGWNGIEGRAVKPLSIERQNGTLSTM